MKITFAPLLVLALATQIGYAQSSTDPLRLEALRAATITNDPRASQIELLASQSLLRLQNIGADLRPAISLDGLAQYQSDVARIDVSLPGVSLPRPKRDTYDARIGAQQRLYDPTIGPRRSVERAQLAESQSRVRSALYLLNEAVNTAYFTALRAQTSVAELETTVTDLEAQLKVADARVNERAALPSESNALRAEILRRQQVIAEQRAARRAAIAVLSDLTGRPIDSQALLSSPDLTTESRAARTNLAAIRARPEYDQFARARDVLEQSANARAAQDKPRVLAFGRAGYGRPGLNPLASKFDTFWLGGIQLQWTPWTWGTTSRERQLAALQSRIVSTEEEAFTAQLRRAVEHDLAAIDRLESALADDDRIIALRENILAETRARYRESVVSSAEFVDRQTDVLSARLSRALHRVELAQAQAHLLTTLGVEVR